MVQAKKGKGKMEPTDKMNKRMHDEGIVNSFGEARRIQHQMPDEKTLESFLLRHMKSNKGPSGGSIFDLETGEEIFPEPERPGYL